MNVWEGTKMWGEMETIFSQSFFFYQILIRHVYMSTSHTSKVNV